MEQRVREVAHLSVMRGCGFGMIAIVMTMLALGEQPVMSLQFGGISLLVDELCSHPESRARSCCSAALNEVWIMLRPDDRRPNQWQPA